MNKLPIGVEKNGNKYAAKSKINGKRIFIGNFSTPKKAKIAYDNYIKNNTNKLMAKISTGFINNLEGKKFGRLLVLDYLEDRIKRKPLWLCLCDCGNIIETTSYSLTTENTKSCGCYKIEITKQVNSKKQGEAYFNRILDYYIKNAKRRNIKFKLTKKQFKNIITKNCHYCNSVPKDYSRKKPANGSFLYTGVDRIDSSKSYNVKNCVSCCRICNRAKSNLSYNIFIDWINKLKNIGKLR